MGADDQGGQETSFTRRWLWLALGLAAVLAVGVASYMAGVEAGDDSAQVAELESGLDDAAADLSTAELERDDLRERLDDATSENESLMDRLEAETGLSGDELEVGEPGSGPKANHPLGAAASVGDLIVKPTSVEIDREATGKVIWFARITVKNNGSRSVSPYCGGSDAQLLDSEGRRYDGDGVISFNSNTANCSDLQPGLTKDNFVVRFTLPPGAEPAVLRLSGNSFSGPYETWYVK